MAVIFLHAGIDNGEWFASWRLEPLPFFIIVAAAIGYWLAFRASQNRGHGGPPGWHAAAYFAGLAVLVAALMGPPDHFADSSFLAHMIQHLLFMQVAAPLIILGRPIQTVLRGLPPRTSRALLRATLARQGVRRALGLIAHPVSVILAFNGSVLFWHLPTFYDAAVQHPLVHDLEHAAFFWAALLFWWVIISPSPRTLRPSPTAALLMLFATWMIGDLLGAVLTLSREPLYPVYAAIEPPWGLSAADDQRLGGLIMWASGGSLYVVVMIGILAAPFLRRRTIKNRFAHANSFH